MLFWVRLVGILAGKVDVAASVEAPPGNKPGDPKPRILARTSEYVT